MIPSQDIFREFAGSFKRAPEERKVEEEEETKISSSQLQDSYKPMERKRKYLVDPAEIKSYAFVVHKEKQSFF